MNYYIYIARCRDSSLYTGYTSNVKKRIVEHNSSKRGAKSVKGKLPVKLVYLETYTTKTEALRREIEIKGWNRKKKLELINCAALNTVQR